MATIGKSTGPIHTTDNGMVFWLLESPGNSTSVHLYEVWSSVDQCWTSPQPRPTKLFMKLGRSYSTILSCCSIQKPFRQCRTMWKKISQTKLASSKATINIHWNKTCKMKLSGLLDTQSYLLTHFMWHRAWIPTRQPGDRCTQSSSWGTAHKEQEAARQSRAASPASAHCRQPGQGIAKNIFIKGLDKHFCY